jgi:hypothetical protein
VLLRPDQPRPRAARAGRGRLLARRATAVALLGGFLAVLTAAAWAYWSASATPGSVGAAAAATVNQGATPSAIAAAGRKVTVSWGASTLSGGHAVDGYVVKRYDAATAALQTTLSSCAGTISATTCIERGVPSGQWQYSVTPVFATHWQGPEGAKSGVVTVGDATITLAKTIFGAPLPQNTTGALAGFSDAEGVSYRLDASTPLTGSPSSVGSDGTAAITSLTIPSTTEGAHTVYAIGDAAPSPSMATVAIVTDTIAPAVSALVTPAPNGAGWSSSAPVQVALSADDGSGSGIDHIRYTTDGTDPLSSGTAQTYASALSLNSDTTVRSYATDLAGNASVVHTQLVKIDATAPANALSLSDVSGGAYLTGTTVYYRGSGAGSFTLTNAATDAGGSGVAASATAALTGTATGWTHAPSVVTTPGGGPYVSASFGWSAGTASSPGEHITATDVAGNTTTTALTLTADSAGPAAGALTVNGVAAAGAPSTSASTTGSFSIARTDYTDAGSGLSASVLTRETATLSSSDGVAAGTCGTFGSASVLTGSPAQSVSGPNCYRYTLTGTDRVGNVSAIATIAKVDATAPSAPVLTLSAATGDTYVAGAVVYINAQAGRSGGFHVAAATTDAGSGIEKVNFPVLTGFGSGDGDDASSPFATTYAWSGAVGASGSKTVTAANTVAGSATAAFTVTPDTTAPVTGALTVNGSASASVSTTGSYAISRTDYTDAGSGLASSVLTRETATLSSTDAIAAGTCGSYGTPAVLAGAPAQTVTGPSCYRYTLTGTDNVGNVSTTTSIVKVDTTGPSAPALTLSGATGGTYTTGTAVFINAQAGRSGSFQIAATTTDADSGIQKVNFPLLTGFTSGDGDDSAAPFATTYAWSGAVGATGSKTVTSTNTATGTATSTFTITADTTAPATGALTVNGSAASSYSTTGSYAISRTDYTDAGSGLASSVLTRETATLSSSDAIAAGTCGTYGTASVLVGAPAQTVTGPSCYRYTLTGTDNVGNVSTTTSIVKVDTTGPSAPALTLSGATGNTYISGTTVFTNPQAGRSGSFQVAATPTDADSGIQKVTFPALTGFTGAGASAFDDLASPFSTTYSWSGAGATATGAKTVTAVNDATATATSTFTVTPDITSPTVTSVVARESDGTTVGDGRLELNDRLILTFSEELLPASVPSTFSGTETRAASGLLQTVPDVVLTITGFTNGGLDTNSNAYLSSGLLCVLGVCSAGTATFGGTATLSGSNTIVTLVVTSLTGDATAAGGPATMSFAPSSALQDRVGNGATGTLSLTSFRLF